jgi:hypothetical protein
MSTTAPGVHEIKELDRKSELSRKGVRIGDLIVGINDLNFEGSCRFEHNALNNLLSETPRPMVLHFHRRRNNLLPSRTAHKDDKTVVLNTTDTEFKFRCVGVGKMEVDSISSSGFAEVINTVAGDAVWGVNGVQLDEMLRDPSNPDELRQLVENADRPVTINVTSRTETNLSAGKDTRRRRSNSNKENLYNAAAFVAGEEKEKGYYEHEYFTKITNDTWDARMRGQDGQQKKERSGEKDLITFAAEPTGRRRTAVPTRKRAQSLLEQEYEKTLNALMKEAD